MRVFRHTLGHEAPGPVRVGTDGEVHMATATKTWQMYVGGAWVDSSGGEAEPNIDPSTESVADEVQIGTRDDADRAVEAAQKAFVYV